MPLFSGPARPEAAGWGVVRAQLREPSGRKAAWALLEVTPDGAPAAVGMADHAGRVAVAVPYPEPSATAGSPPRGTSRPLSAERWPVRITCRYGGTVPATRAPDLCRALEQAPAALDLGSAPLELAYGRDLVLRTPNRSELLVVAAASPP